MGWGKAVLYTAITLGAASTAIDRMNSDDGAEAHEGKQLMEGMFGGDISKAREKYKSRHAELLEEQISMRVE